MKLFENTVALSSQRPIKLRGQSILVLDNQLPCTVLQLSGNDRFQLPIPYQVNAKHFYLSKDSNFETMLYPLCITAEILKCKFSLFVLCFTSILYTKSFELPKFQSIPSPFYCMQTMSYDIITSKMKL